MATNYEDIIRGKSVGTTPTQGETDYDAIIRGKSSYTPSVVQKTAPVVKTPVESPKIQQAVAQTYPVAKPEPIEPKSLFQKYGEWSEKTGKSIASTFGDLYKSEIEYKKNTSALKQLADPFGVVRRFQENITAKALNTDVAKEITKQVYDKTSKIGLKTYARMQSIGEKTYDEAYQAALKKSVDPTNNQLERIMYGLADSGLQSIAIAGISLATAVVARSPMAGRAVAGGMFGSVATEAERMDKGTITPTGTRNIVIDTAGDIVLSNWAETALKSFGAKSAAKLLSKEGLKSFSKSFAKAFGIEGGTEVAQSFAKYGNEYASANTPAERAQIVDKLKEYVTSGAMIDELFIGGFAGGGIASIVEIAARAGIGQEDAAQRMGIQAGKEDKEKQKKEIEESGIGESIRAAIETNSEEEIITALQAKTGVSDQNALKIIQIATTPSLPTEEEVAQHLQEVEDKINMESASTEELIDNTEEIMQQFNEAKINVSNTADQLKYVEALLKELEKRPEPEAQVAVEAISLLPAPKSMEATSVPKDIENGDTVKITTKATGVARDAEVVEVRKDSVVAVIKGDAHFPEVPMVYPIEHFTTKINPPKESAGEAYAIFQAKKKAQREAFVKSQQERVPELRANAEKAKKHPAIAKTFTKKADEIEGKKPAKKETAQTKKEERTDATVKGNASNRRKPWQVEYTVHGAIVHRNFSSEEEANRWIDENATRSERRQKIHEMVETTKNAPQSPVVTPVTTPVTEKPSPMKRLTKEEEDHLFGEKPSPSRDQEADTRQVDHITDSGKKVLTDDEAYSLAEAEWREEQEKGKEAYELYQFDSTLDFALKEISTDSKNMRGTQSELWDMYRNKKGTKEERVALMLGILRERKERLLEAKEQFDKEKQAEEKPTGALTLESAHKIVDNIRTGKTTAEELKANFEQFVAQKSMFIEEIGKMSKEEIMKKYRLGYRARPSDKKAALVEHAYRSMIDAFTPNKNFSWSPFSETIEQATARIVSTVTDEDIQTAARAREEAIARRDAERAKVAEGMKNPQTIEDFRNLADANGLASLTTEQRIKYDELQANAVKERTEKEIKQKALVRGVDAGVGFEMKQTKHTKTGEDIFIVNMGARVENEIYSQLVKSAGKIGGYYSRFSKGFIFKTAEDAQAFMKAGQGENVDAGAKMEERAGEQKTKTTNKLSALADSLEERATKKLNQDRKTNTAKRAREASGAEGAARMDIQLARTMRNLAGAIESGRAKYLDGISAKTHIEELESALRQAKWKQRNIVETKYRQNNKDITDSEGYLNYDAREAIRKLQDEVENGPVTDETISALDDIFPEFIGGNLITDIIEPASKKKGFKLLANRYMKIIPKGDKRWSPKSFEQINDLASMSKEVDATGMYMYGIERAQRLQRMGVVSTPQFRAMLREYVTFRGDAVEEDKVKQLERELVGRKVGFDFFPTPHYVADQMVQEAGITAGMKVLEPSAGNGNIADAIRDVGGTPDVIEISSELRAILEAKGYNVVGNDFLEHTETGYDAIIQNPPFGTNDDIKHVQHAYDLLKPGGKLVSIVGEGAFIRSGKTETAFREWLDARGADIQELPADTFKDTSLLATTGARGRMVIIEKPEVSFMRRDDLGRFAREDSAEYIQSVIDLQDETFAIDVSQLNLANDNEYNDAVGDVMEGQESLTDLPVLVEQENDGTYSIVDGRHRVAQTILNKGTKVKVTENKRLYDAVASKMVAFSRKTELTTTLLQKLEGRETVSKQFITDLTKSADMKLAEKSLILKTLEGEVEKVNVQDFVNKVKTELLPLDFTSSTEGEPMHENMTLPDDMRGDVEIYEEKVYSSPIPTSAGKVHFAGEGSENYFAHTRIEDMSPTATNGTVRRVIEVQSDLFQKGRLEKEVNDMWNYAEPDDNGALAALKASSQAKEARAKELAPLQPYRNTWQERVIREEVAQAAKDGKTKLQFPTGETAMKIEGLGSQDVWKYRDDKLYQKDLQVENLKVGLSVEQFGGMGAHAGQYPVGNWIITDVLGDGKFKAVPKDKIGQRESEGLLRGENINDVQNSRYIETFDISGKVDTENPIYKFYEKEVAKYLRNKYGAKLVTDDQGVTWNEVTITPDMAKSVTAFSTRDLENHLNDAIDGQVADSAYGLKVLADIKERMNYGFNVRFYDAILTGDIDKAVYAMTGKKEAGKAWGATLGNEISIAKGAPVRVLPHEVLGHFTIKNLDQMESEFGMSRIELLTAHNNGIMPRSREEEEKIEESLVKDFETVWEANQRGEGHTFTGAVGRFFDRLVAFVKGILNIKLTERELILQFYDKILYMRRKGPTIFGEAHDMSRFETAPGVLNFGGEKVATMLMTPEQFDALSEEEQRDIIAQEAMEDIIGYDTLSPIEELAESLLNGTQKVSTRTDIKNDIRETMGNALYMRMFRKNAVESWDELTANLNDALGTSYRGNDLVDVVIARDKARKLAAHEQAVARKQAREEITKRVGEAKTEADKVKLLKEIQRELTKKLLKEKATTKDLGQKQGLSKFQHRTAERFGQMGSEKLPYQKITKAGEQAKAEAYYDANKQRTINMALGTEAMPEDVTQNMVSIAVIQKAQAQGDATTVAQALPKLSLRSTRFGQEISMLRDIFNDRDPVAYMAKLLSFRKLLIEKKYKPLFSSSKEAKGFEQIVEEKVKKARQKSPRLSDLLEVKGKEIDDFLNSLAC